MASSSLNLGSSLLNLLSESSHQGLFLNLFGTVNSGHLVKPVSPSSEACFLIHKVDMITRRQVTMFFKDV